MFKNIYFLSIDNDRRETLIFAREYRRRRLPAAARTHRRVHT